MRFHVLTLFPQMIEQGLSESCLLYTSMPGMGIGGGKMPDIDTDEAEKGMARTEAIIYSMTSDTSTPAPLAIRALRLGLRSFGFRLSSGVME